MNCEHKYGDEYCPRCGIKLYLKEKPIFPYKTVIYLHSNKDSMWEKGLQIGLSEDAISCNFAYCLCEIGIEIEVNEDGSYKILGIKQ